MPNTREAVYLQPGKPTVRHLLVRELAAFCWIPIMRSPTPCNGRVCASDGMGVTTRTVTLARVGDYGHLAQEDVGGRLGATESAGVMTPVKGCF